MGSNLFEIRHSTILSHISKGIFMKTLRLSLFWQDKHPQCTSCTECLEENMMTYHKATNSHLKTQNRQMPWCHNYKVSKHFTREISFMHQLKVHFRSPVSTALTELSVRPFSIFPSHFPSLLQIGREDLDEDTSGGLGE